VEATKAIFWCESADALPFLHDFGRTLRSSCRKCWTYARSTRTLSRTRSAITAPSRGG